MNAANGSLYFPYSQKEAPGVQPRDGDFPVMNRYFAEQLALHPAADGQDLIKLCYQAVFGAEHLLSDPSGAHAYFLREYAAVPAQDLPLFERIGPDMTRVSLPAWKWRGMDPERLFSLFLATARDKHGTEDEFRALLLSLADENGSVLPGFGQTVRTYLAGGVRPLHHSSRYRSEEMPAYRLVSRHLLADAVPVGETYIWDLDGTLLDSYGVIVSSLAAAAADEGHPVDPADVLTDVKLYSVTHFVQGYAEKYGASPERIMARYRGYNAEGNRGIALIRGAGECLERLRKDGAVHDVYTHRGATAVPILERLGIAGYFRGIVTSEAGFAPKPAPDGVSCLLEKYASDPYLTYYVGDRELDVRCAKAAGVRSILLLEPGSPVRRTGAEDLVISSLDEL